MRKGLAAEPVAAILGTSARPDMGDTGARNPRGATHGVCVTGALRGHFGRRLWEQTALSDQNP